MIFAAALGAATAGCSSSVFDTSSGEGFFSKPITVFAKTEWGSGASNQQVVNLGPSGPVAAEELVSADGRCSLPVSAEAPPVQPVAEQPPTQVADRRVGSMAGDLAGPAMPAATPASVEPALDPNLPQVAGGIALGMTECQAVRRAGLPSSVSIGAGDGGERRTVLTYLGGSWPGIYTFQSGRLKEIARAPEPPKPEKPVKKKIIKKKAKTTQGASPVSVR